MKITLDLTSIVVGGAVALALGVVAGFSPQVTSVPAARPATAVTTMGANRPAARDIVFLQAAGYPCSSPGGPGVDSPTFTVPAGKILVITALTHSIPGESVTLLIDGVEERYYNAHRDGLDSSVASQPISFDLGIPLREGQTVQVLHTNFYNYCNTRLNLHGYLEDA